MNTIRIIRDIESGSSIFKKEADTMIKTAEYRLYGQLEEQAEGTADIEAFVFRNGEVVPADSADASTGLVIHTAPEKNYGQLEEQAEGTADIEAFVFRNGEVVPASQMDASTGLAIHTAPEKNYGQLEEQANGTVGVEEFVFRRGEVVPAAQAETSTGPVIHTSNEDFYGVVDEFADSTVNIEDFVFTSGSTNETSGETFGPVIHTAKHSEPWSTNCCSEKHVENGELVPVEDGDMTEQSSGPVIITSSEKWDWFD